MLRYVVHRLLIMVPTLLAISLITFVIIQLPPGDYLESYIAELQAQGESIQGEKIEYLRQVYGFDQPWWQQYLRLARRPAPRRLRLFLRVRPAGHRRGRRPHAADHHRVVRDHPVHLGGVVPDRRLFGDPQVQLAATTG